MPSINHVLLTRFNLPSGGVESLVRAREGWLRDRIELFERYTIPSVAAQRGPAVTWVVYFDPESPGWLMDRIAPHAERGLLRPVLREQVSGEELLADLEKSVESRGDVLLTTNLDNDDGLAVDFCQRLAEAHTPHPRTALYMSHGLILSPAGLYARTDKRNAFCSVREPWEDAVTCWSEFHNELPSVMPVVEVGGAPGWLQVVHGANVSNRVRGRLVSPAAHRPRFAAPLEVAEPSRGALLQDRLVRGPVRAARDGSRSAARRTALRVLGKQRYSDLKAAMARRLRRR